MPWLRRIVPVGRASNGTTWYFVHDGLLHGHGYFVGYNNDTMFKVGYIGRTGFRPDEPPTGDQFSIDGRRVTSAGLFFSLSVRTQPEQEAFVSSNGNRAGFFHLVVDDGFVRIDLDNRTAKVMLKDPNFISASNLNGMIAVRTPDRIRILQPDGKEIRSYPLPKELRDVLIEVYELPKNSVVLYDRWRHQDLFWLDAAGKVVRQDRVALHIWSQPRWISPAAENFMVANVVIPSPGAIVAALGFDAWKRGNPQRLRELWPDWWPGLLGTAVISLVLAVLCYRHHRKYGLPWTWVWTAFVLLFGVPAFLGYLAHRSWPARLPCPHCGRRVPRDRPACLACARDFPPSPPKGIEVFA
jgi:hypothetical protein